MRRKVDRKQSLYIIFIVILFTVVAVVIFYPQPILFYQHLPFLSFLRRAVFILILSCLLCFFRILRGPIAAERLIAFYILGLIIIGLCAVTNVSTGRSWYLDIAIAWALQSFIGTLALVKFLEGKTFDD